MHYKELFKKHKLFKDYDDKWYDMSRQKTDWQNLQNLTIEEVKNEIIWFLNKWRCRIGPERILDLVAKGIKGRCVEAASLLEILNSETLEDIDFEQNKKVGHKQISNSRIIHNVFSMFSNIGYRFRWTATSKVLHMINPKLFVMWDDAICDGYFLALSAPSYAYRFMR